METKPELCRLIFPYVRVYKDGTIERLVGTEKAPAGLDHETNVLSKDITIIPETGVSARLYRPNSTKPHQKLPLVIYFHGGGFFISSVADPNYHNSLNKIVAESKIILVSIDYRLAPETPLPGAYEDSWAALEWVAFCGNREPWLDEFADFGKVFLAGDSCGANVANALCLKLNDTDKQGCRIELKIEGIAMINPYFWGKDPIGVEIIDKQRKAMVDDWWMFVCPPSSIRGCDDPLINPFKDGCSRLEDLGCEKVIVFVAEKDILRERGKLYYENLVKSGWKGKAQIFETKDEEHVFHIFDPNSDNAKSLFKLLASFFNQP